MGREHHLLRAPGRQYGRRPRHGARGTGSPLRSIARLAGLRLQRELHGRGAARHHQQLPRLGSRARWRLVRPRLTEQLRAVRRQPRRDRFAHHVESQLESHDLRLDLPGERRTRGRCGHDGAPFSQHDARRGRDADRRTSGALAYLRAPGDAVSLPVHGRIQHGDRKPLRLEWRAYRRHGARRRGPHHTCDLSRPVGGVARRRPDVRPRPWRRPGDKSFYAIRDDSVPFYTAARTPDS